MPRFNEKSLVEDYIVSEMQRRGWQFTPSENLERENLGEPLLTSALVRALRRLNAGIGAGDGEIKQAVNELKLKSSGSEGCKQALNYFKHGIPVKFDREKVVKYVKLFDHDNVRNNEFVISRQVVHRSGDNEIVNDIILYVNGIPLVDIECKNPARMTETWYDAYKQIKDYEKKVPELFKYVQVGIAAEVISRYFPIASWQEETKTDTWREPGKDEIDSTIEMLTPVLLLSLIKDYMFFRIEHGGATKVIARYMQLRAAEQIYNRVVGNLQEKESKTRGLIWHWQGSGKTLTMIFAANKLYPGKQLENPTIFFVVDRVELQTQLYDEFTALDLTKPEIIDNMDALKRILRYDEGRGKRGIFIVLIQKFRPEEFRQLQEELQSRSKTGETILDRRNVIVFIDEAHRTQYGTLAGQMRLLLQNAFFFALTGTPVSKTGRDTYREFSYPPGELYLDKYFITSSIEDGFTVKICYQPRLEKDVHLNRELLDSFIQAEFEELPEEYRERVEGKVRGKLDEIKVFLENEKRIGLVTKDVVEHFKENVDGKFKALIVAVNRLACIRYKRQLDKLLPREYSEVVMSFEGTAPQEILDYQRELVARYNGKETKDIIKEIIDKYKDDEYPKILIVTEMLLTGFDAPVLQTMYLDKPLKEHRLLQAIARTNRPYKDVKEAGLIIDYVGILKELTKALANYTKEDVKGVLHHLDQMREEFVHILDQTLKLFEDIPKDRVDRQAMLKAVEVLTRNEQDGKKFQENYNHLRRLFELLGPDVVKVQRLSEYVWLTQVYVYYLRLLRMDEADETRYVERYFEKTVKYVHESTELGDIEKALPVVAFDENYLRNLEGKIKTTKEKAANIVFALNRFVLVEKERNPIYESLVEKVERILRLWKEKNKDFENIYRQGTEIFKEIGGLQARQKQLGFTDFEYSLLLTLEKKLGASTDLVEDVRELTGHLRPQMFKGWYFQQTARKTIERDVRRYVRKYIKKYGMGLSELEELYKRIMESLRWYGQQS